MAKKANPYLEFTSIPVKNHFPCQSRGFNAIELQPVAGWTPHSSSVSISLCCQQVGHWVVAVSRSAWAYLCIASIPVSIDLLFIGPLYKNWVAKDRNWLTYTGWVIIINWLFKSSLCRYYLVGITLRHKDLYILCLLPFIHQYASSPDLLTSNFPVLLLSGPWPTSKSLLPKRPYVFYNSIKY